MMAAWLISFMLLSSANVDSILSAKSPAKLLQGERLEGEVGILKQRCEAEVRGVFFPANCFRWARIAPLGPNERKFFGRWFDETCVKALQRDGTLVRFHLGEIASARGACRGELLEAARNWLYKVQKEGDTQILQRLKVGRDFEMLLAHEILETRQSHRHPLVRTLR
jgi:hypothetical protein